MICGKTIEFLSALTDKQDLKDQKLEILEWTHKKTIHVDDFVEIAILRPLQNLSSFLRIFPKDAWIAY